MKISIKETLKNHKGNVEHQSILLASISTDVDARRHRRLRKGIESLNHNNFTIALPSFAMVATTNDLLCRRRRGHGNYSRSPKLTKHYLLGHVHYRFCWSTMNRLVVPLFVWSIILASRVLSLTPNPLNGHHLRVIWVKTILRLTLFSTTNSC